MSDQRVTYADAERALLRSIVDAAEDGLPSTARDLAQALLALRQAQATEKAAGGAAAGDGIVGSLQVDEDGQRTLFVPEDGSAPFVIGSGPGSARS